MAETLNSKYDDEFHIILAHTVMRLASWKWTDLQSTKHDVPGSIPALAI